MENFDALMKSFQQADSWTCIVTQNEHLHRCGSLFKDRTLVIEYVCENLHTGDAAYSKFNKYIDDNKHKIIDHDYYMFLMDDEIIPSGFVASLKKTDSPVVFVSAKRGQKIPQRAKYKHQHPTTDLVAHPNNVCVGSISACQIIVKGSVLKQMEFKTNNPCADGMMAMWLKSKFPVAYLPNLFIKFNYLEPGRWNIPIPLIKHI
jgi:hypothetical protein